MLAWWAAGFLVGCCLGKLEPAEVSLAETSAMIVILCAAPLAAGVAARVRLWKVIPLICLVGGLIWGYSHSRPVPCGKLGAGKVVFSGTTLASRGPVIVAARSGWYESHGVQIPGGALGVVGGFPTGGLLEPCRGVFRASYVPPSEPVGHVFGRVRLVVHDFLRARTAWLPTSTRGWARGVLLGDRSGISPEIRQAFVTTGTYHLLVISGLHMSFAAGLFMSLVKAPVQWLYALRLVGPRTWFHLDGILGLLAASVVLGYAALVGFGAASQRAALSFAVLVATPLFLGRITLEQRLCIAFVLQCLWFPMSVYSDASLLSWVAYILVLGYGTGRFESWRHRLWALVRLQIKLAVAVTAVFGQMAVAGVICNLIVVPLFPAVYVCSLLSLMGSEFALLFVWAQDFFIEAITQSAALAEKIPGAYWDRSDLSVWIRGLCVFITLGVVLNSMKLIRNNRHVDALSRAG